VITLKTTALFTFNIIKHKTRQDLTSVKVQNMTAVLPTLDYEIRSMLA